MLESENSPRLERDGRTNKIRLKCHYNNDIRVVRITNKILFVSLKERLENDFGFTVSLKYKDTDDDLINLDNQNDLNELIETESGSVTVLVSRASGTTPMGESPMIIHSGDDADGELSSSRDSRVSLTPSPALRPAVAESRMTVEVPRQTPPTAPASPVVPPGSSAVVASAVPPDVLAVVRPDVLERAICSQQRQKSRQKEISDAVQRKGWRWQRGEVLGQGAFGTVFLGLNLNSGELMAVKQLDTNEVTKKDLMLLEHEISMMRGLNHKNIVRYLGTDRTDDSLSIFMEYVPGGSIRSLLERFGALKESVVRMYTRQLLLGLEYLHQNGIAHRDIKGANILVANDGTIKLADFGASKNLTQPSLTATGLKGTPMWMAPEVIRQQQTSNGWKKADVWSVGCTVVEMATGKPPWAQFDNPVTAMYQIACADALPSIPDDMSEQGRTFLHKCLTRDPDSRPDATSLLLVPFVAFVKPWAVRSTPTQLLQRPNTSGDSKSRLPLQEYWPIRETHSRASSKKKNEDEALAESIELRPDVSISLNESFSDNDELPLSDSELNEELRAAISKNRPSAELEDSLDGEMNAMQHDSKLRDVSRASAASSAAPISSQAGLLRKPVLGSLIKRNNRRRADSACDDVDDAVRPLPMRASTVGQYGSNMLKGMPPLRSSESPTRMQAQSDAPYRSPPNRKRRDQTLETSEPKRSHLQTQLVSFDLDSSLDDLALASPPRRTASAPTTNQLKHAPIRRRDKAMKVSSSSSNIHGRKRGAGPKSASFTIQNSRNRRRPRSDSAKAVGDTSESHSGAKTKHTQEDLRGLVIGGVSMRS